MLETFPPVVGSGSKRAAVVTRAKPGADRGSRGRRASTRGASGFGADLGAALSVEAGSADALTSINLGGLGGRYDLLQVFSPQRSHVLQPLRTICWRETSVTLTSV